MWSVTKYSVPVVVDSILHCLEYTYISQIMCINFVVLLVSVMVKWN